LPPAIDPGDGVRRSSSNSSWNIRHFTGLKKKLQNLRGKKKTRFEQIDVKRDVREREREGEGEIASMPALRVSLTHQLAMRGGGAAGQHLEAGRQRALAVEVAQVA